VSPSLCSETVTKSWDRYSEAIPLLYSRNIFHFHNPGDIRHFSRTILPQRLNQVQSLVIDWERPYSIFNEFNTIPKRGKKEYELWCQAWAIIRDMQNLRDLAVILKKHKFNVPQERREKMCQPMMEIQGLRTYELRIPWDDPTDWYVAFCSPRGLCALPILRCSIPSGLNKCVSNHSIGGLLYPHPFESSGGYHLQTKSNSIWKRLVLVAIGIHCRHQDLL